MRGRGDQKEGTGKDEEDKVCMEIFTRMKQITLYIKLKFFS